MIKMNEIMSRISVRPKMTAPTKSFANPHNSPPCVASISTNTVNTMTTRMDIV